MSFNAVGFFEKISSPDYSGMSILDRRSREAAAADFLASQNVAKSVMAPAEPPREMQEVRSIDMSLPANGRPAFAQETA